MSDQEFGTSDPYGQDEFVGGARKQKNDWVPIGGGKPGPHV